MQLRADGPDIPEELLAAQEKGEVLFICGAGVSKNAGLPLFRELVIGIYNALGENWCHPVEKDIMHEKGSLYGQYDRALGCLKRRLTEDLPLRRSGRRLKRFNDAVSDQLQPPRAYIGINAHSALLELSRDPDSKIRLITTNFDTLFERNWPRRGMAPSSAGPAMPQPKTANFEGVLHLHGRIADRNLGLTETDFVLTSPEFGEAYLRSGWASRYVYDLVRAYTVVLVGYQADDPPMRYLLEALEADRQRFADLKKVYAFAKIECGKEKTQAMWKSKGVVPILHGSDKNGGYGPLYRTINEWKKYARNPTAWRKRRLQKLFANDPNSMSADAIKLVVNLLHRRDASYLLWKLNPTPNWLPFLNLQRIFDVNSSSLGRWIAIRVEDSEMIRAAVDHPYFDEQTIRDIERSIEQNWGKLDPVLIRSWEALLSAKIQQPDFDDDFSWFSRIRRFRPGGFGYEGGRFIANLLRPRVKVERASSLYLKSLPQESDSQTLKSFMRIKYESTVRGEYRKIIDALPEDVSSLKRLLRILDQTLFNVLEQAEDFEYESQSDYDVPSIASHTQNRFRYGFYPIVRVMADIWERIALATPVRAIELSKRWIQSPFVLFRRLAIFAMTNSVHPASDLAKTIIQLSDSDFWISGARVEIMRGVVERWEEFSLKERENIEKRICEGPSIELYDIEDNTDADHSWPLVQNSSIYRRLKRLEMAGRRLDSESRAKLERISKDYPEWRPSPADQDDFRVWHYDIMDDQTTTPRMLEDMLLEDMPDAKLVEEKLRNQREKPVDQFGLWNAYCSSDPERAYRLLKEEAARNTWNLYAWRALLSATRESQDGNILKSIADAIHEIPESKLGELSDSIAIWVEENQDILATMHRNNDSMLWLLWKRLSNLVYSDTTVARNLVAEPVYLESIGSAADSLARTLVKQLVANKLERGAGLGDLESYFDLIVRSESEFGIRGRKRFASELGIIHWVSPDWAGKEMLPRFQPEHGESLDLWKNFALGRTGSAKLFNKLKMPMLDMISRPELSDRETDSLVGRLVWALIQCRLELIEDCDLSAKDVRKLLATGPLRLLDRFAWQLRDRQSNGLPASWSAVENLNDKGARWKDLVGPIFEEIWPLDALKRTENASRELVKMVMDTEDAFPEAVDKVIDYLKPYRLNSIEMDLLLGTVHDEMVDFYPRDMIILADALIDPQYHPLPRDLGKFLDDCREADSGIIDEPAYYRLDGFRRLEHS